jgi:HNH endonuclease
MGRPRVPLRDRLLKQITADPDSDCWLWTGYVDPAGYASIRVGGGGSAELTVQRAAYQLFVGPIPEGLTIDHLCRVRHCANPEHLEAVTMRENTLRGDTLPARNAAKTHCLRGHPFDEANTGFQPGGRYCLTCKREGWGRRQSDGD